MALFTPSESPAVVVKEIDLTGGVPNVQSTTGAIAGNFKTGPFLTPTKISNEAELVSTFGAPDDSNAVDFLSAAYFLKYSGSLYVVRTGDSDVMVNAYDALLNNDSSGLGAYDILVKSPADFDNQKGTLAAAGHVFIAREPGIIGNSLKVETCPYSASDTAFNAWEYRGSFNIAPGTSTYASNRNASNDEYHVAVIDRTGLITGTANTVLETFQNVSFALGAKNPDGTTNFGPDVVNSKSRLIYHPGFGSGQFTPLAGTYADSGDNFLDASYDDVGIWKLVNGANTPVPSLSNYIQAYDLLSDKDAYEIDFMIAPGLDSSEDQITLVNNLVSIAENTRKDCVVITSPSSPSVLNQSASSAVAATVTEANNYNFSTYLIVDNNWLKIYDKFNDKYRYIPAASSTAGIMAASDLNTAPWFSPAGPRRGRYFGVTDVQYSPTKAQRDTLYKAGINPIANIPGQGLLLYGDKTHLTRVSAFDRINVRRLFLVLERAIARAAENTLFELNDEFTRAEFVNIVEPVLRNVKGRRGITDFRVICDETNNTPDVIDRNEFIASIFIKPARSINYITLNFVGVRTGVDFEEVVGTV